GNATAYSISDDHGGTFNLGFRLFLTVRPAQSTVYTLHAQGPGGALVNPPTATVSVDTSHPASRLIYTAPVAAAPLRLVDDAFADGTELARFTLTLAGGGRGRIFSAEALAANPVYKAVIQTASGRTANALAVGALDAD